jgi:hypothetical protein
MTPTRGGVGIVLNEQIANDQIVAVLHGATRVHGDAADARRSAELGHVIRGAIGFEFRQADDD